MKKWLAALLLALLVLGCCTVSLADEITMPQCNGTLFAGDDDPEDLPDIGMALENEADDDTRYLTEEEFDALYFPETKEVTDSFYVSGRLRKGLADGEIEMADLKANPSDPITLAYTERNYNFLYVNKSTTFKVTVDGGAAPYKYSYYVYYQSFNSTNRSYSFETKTLDTTSSSFAFKPTKEGRYALYVKVVDKNNNYVAFHCGIMMTAYASDTGTSTMKGLVEWVVENFTSHSDSEYNKALKLHNWLCNWTSYDGSHGYYEADGVLLHYEGVCSGYAGAYELLCKEAGLQCITVHGYGNVTSAVKGNEHAWNLVKVGGDWYHVDCTWDDGNNGAIYTDYFLVPDSVMARDHYWDYSYLDATSGSLPSSSYVPRATATWFSDGYYGVYGTMTGMKMSASTVSVAVGGTTRVSVVTTPSVCRKHGEVWYSANESIACVNDYGVIEGIADGTTYIYCKDSTGTYKASCLVKVGTGKTTPNITSITQPAAKQLTVKWKSVPGASGYTLYRATSENGTYTAVKNVTETKATVTGLTPGATYYFKVRAYSLVNGTRNYTGFYACSPVSDVVVAGPAAPYFYSLTSTSPITAKLLWLSSSGADGYSISRSHKSATAGFMGLKSTKNTTEYSYGLSNGVTYYFRVRAYKLVDGNRIYGDFSSVKSITMPVDSKVGKPVMRSISQYAKGAARIYYTAAANAEGYTLYMSTSLNGTYTAIKSSAATSMDKINLTKGQTYYFKVRAYRMIGSYRSYGEYSAAAPVTIK